MIDCINWQGSKWSQGRYGADQIDGKWMGAHRAAWIRANGPIPEDMHVCHRCDNGLCVNVEHLFLGTRSENMQDCMAKGRFRTNLGSQKGQLNRNAKPGLVARNESIRRDRRAGLSLSQIKSKYGLKSNGHLCSILSA